MSLNPELAKSVSIAFKLISFELKWIINNHNKIADGFRIAFDKEIPFELRF